MAGMFYSLEEVAKKLNKTTDEVKEIVREGRLREFRDGSKLLFKADEVEALVQDTAIMEVVEAGGEAESKEVMSEEELLEIADESIEDLTGGEQEEKKEVKGGDIPDIISLEDTGEPLEDIEHGKVEPQGLSDSLIEETLGTPKGKEDLELTSADTVLAEESSKPAKKPKAGKGSGKKASSDTSETSLKEIEDDLSLDSFGSGSGLLDLSLQADDTSLGGILDEIYTAPTEGEAEVPAAVDLTAEAEGLLPERTAAGAEAVLMASVQAEPLQDRVSNAFGIMLFLPMLVVIYTAIVAIAGFEGVMPGVLSKINTPGPLGVHAIWYIMAVVGVLSLAIVGVPMLMGLGGGVQKPKAKKAAKPKKSEKPKESPKS